MEFLGVGAGEALLVFVLILILVGPQRFPELMRQGGHWYRIARGYTTEVMKDVRAAVDELEQEVKEETELDSIRELTDVGREIEQDMSSAQRDLDRTGSDTAAAARSSTEQPRPISSARSASRPGAGTGTPSESSSQRPSTRQAEAPATDSTPSDSAETAPARDSAAPAEREAAPPAPRRITTPETPAVPSERVSLPDDDPFQALEARRAAAQQADRGDADEGDSEKANG